MIMFHRDRLEPEVQAALEELNTLLKLEEDNDALRVIYSQVPEDPNDLAMLTRSMLQIMVDMATQVDVPVEHAAEGRTPPSLPIEDGAADNRLMRIHSTRESPEDAFVAVRYRDHWFYIDDRDFKSKRAFTFLMVLFSLTETGGSESLPLVTIPAG